MIAAPLNNVLWLSLMLLAGSVVFGRKGAAWSGWILFGIYWLTKVESYINIQDYFNAVVMILASASSFYLAWLILKGEGDHAARWASSAAAICGLLYFPFAEVAQLSNWLIENTAYLTFILLSIAGVPATMYSWNVLMLNDRTVEIVLACTAIESIALFAGVILSVRAPWLRRCAALILSTSLIYILNLARNAFVLLAYGEQWFGDGSFYLAHNVIAKVGSTVALLLIAYIVFSLLPELLDQVDELAKEIRRPWGGVA